MNQMHDDYDFTAEFYDAFGAYRDRPDVPFFVDQAKRCGGKVLEVGCGTGRVLIPTAKAGVAITGLDLSSRMLNRCRQKLAREEPSVQARVELARGDMRDFSLEGRFALTTLPFRPFQHLVEVEDQLACLRCIGRHLDRGGRIILDVFNPSLKGLTDESRFTESDDGEPFELADGRKVRRRVRLTQRDLFRQVLQIELIYYVTEPGGRDQRLIDSFPMRYLFRYEAEHLLARAGFEVEQLYGDYAGSPYGPQTNTELVFVARKTHD